MSKVSCSHPKPSCALKPDIQHCLVTLTKSTDLGMVQPFLSRDPSHRSIGSVSAGWYRLALYTQRTMLQMVPLWLLDGTFPGNDDLGLSLRLTCSVTFLLLYTLRPPSSRVKSNLHLSCSHPESHGVRFWQRRC